jgi:flagellar protein FliO/FliZ
MKQTSVSPLAALLLLAALATAPAMAQQDQAAATAAAAEASPVTAPAAATVPAAPDASATTTAPNPVRPSQPLGVPAAPYSATSAGGGLMQTTLALFFVIALLLGGAWVLKRFGPRGFGGGSNTVKLVGALSVGARERILVVEVGEQWIVVGASPGRMNALATMPRQEHPETAAGGQPMAAPASFADWIKHTIDKRHGNNSDIGKQ